MDLERRIRDSEGIFNLKLARDRSLAVGCFAYYFVVSWELGVGFMGLYRAGGRI